MYVDGFLWFWLFVIFLSWVGGGKESRNSLNEFIARNSRFLHRREKKKKKKKKKIPPLISFQTGSALRFFWSFFIIERVCGRVGWLRAVPPMWGEAGLLTHIANSTSTTPRSTFHVITCLSLVPMVMAQSPSLSDKQRVFVGK